MRDTDTPEIIAHKLYGDPNKYWIILLANQILDPSSRTEIVIINPLLNTVKSNLTITDYLSEAANKNYTYTIYILLCYMIGCTLNGYRFSYVSVLSIEGEDHKFIESITRDNIIGASLSFIAIIYILFKKYKK
jgi:hypothetical protein